jgi:hypothetical protein
VSYVEGEAKEFNEVNVDRRKFLVGATALAAASRWSSAQTSAQRPSLIIGSALPISVPREFVGLSYESAQLANPEFFSAENKELVGLFRELAPHGNLRLGGGSSEYATYSDAAVAVPFEVFGPDTSKTAKKGTVTSALALKNLRGFLDAVNWSCLYGLNLGQGSVEDAVREAAAVQRILGPRLLAFQIGNEPDSFRKRFRPATYAPADFIAEWEKYHDAIVKVTPQARFAGPDISNKLPYLTAFAEMAAKYPDVVLLTSHYYAMGPASSPEATLDNLLAPDPKLTTLKRRDLHVIAEAQAAAHLPYRMSEGNSCWDGGKAGVSDTFASALWCTDYMLQCATRGWTGVNLHGGGNGYYTPIAGAPSTGFTRRPEYFGMKFAQRFVGATVVDVTLTGASQRVDAFAFETPKRRELVLINKTSEEVVCELENDIAASLTVTLTAPAIDAKQGVRLVEERSKFEHVVKAQAYSASVFRLRS